MPPEDVISMVWIVGVRALVPLLVLRSPFWGALVCIAGDASDVVVRDALGSDLWSGNYHTIDKAFDTWYLGFEAWVAFHWMDPLARWTAVALFALRAGAAVLFEITDERSLFLFGANVFENFYLFIAGMLVLDPGWRVRSWQRLVLILGAVAAPKLLQEYVMHYREAQTWHFVKEDVLRWR